MASPDLTIETVRLTKTPSGPGSNKALVVRATDGTEIYGSEDQARAGQCDEMQLVNVDCDEDCAEELAEALAANAAGNATEAQAKRVKDFFDRVGMGDERKTLATYGM